MKVSLLTPNLLIIPDINDSDFDFIQKVIASTYLSYYEIQKTQFIVLAFGRIFPIGENEEELGTLWVKESMRGQKLGITLMKELIKKKRNKPHLYLAYQKELQTYYEYAGFQKINTIPEKLHFTQQWAKENGYSFVVMKYLSA
jgi:predicted GNAT family N-acyltransferase